MSTRDDLLRRIAEQDQLIAELTADVERLRRQKEALGQRIKDLIHRLYGRKSEKLNPDQLLLLLEQQDQAEADAPAAGQAAHAAEAPDFEELPRFPRRRRKHPGRTPLPAELPRERIEIPIDPQQLVCPCCQQGMRPIGEEITEELGRQPAKLIVRQYVRTKYACPKCQEGVVIPSLPSRAIEKGRAGADVLADILVAKYADHLPLYRQQAIFRREGIDLSRATMCDWVGACSYELEPIVRQMAQEIVAGAWIQSDDTRVLVLEPETKGPPRDGYLWVYVGDQADVVYDFTQSRSQKGPMRFLAGFKGTLQADAYTGYSPVFASGVLFAACMAHVRRKFVEARDTAPQQAAIVLLLLRKLYEIEAVAKDKGLDAAGRLAVRQQEALPILEQLKELLDGYKAQVLPKSPLGKAIAYTLNLWEALLVYANDGRLEIDNNSAERAMRRVAVGRKNWLFAGTVEGGRRAAVIYSLIETCSRHGINPHEYLTDVLRRVGTHPQARIADLTPRGWKRARENLAGTPAGPPGAAATANA